MHVDWDANQDALDGLLGGGVQHLGLDGAVVRDPGDEDELALGEGCALLLVGYLEVDETETRLGLWVCGIEGASKRRGGGERERVLRNQL